MTSEEALRELTGAKADKLPWMRIAEILQAARKTQRAGRLSGEFMNEAGKASGYAPGLLRRLEAARQFLLDLDRDHPELLASERLGEAAAMVFKVEQLKRIYGVDREKALSLYEDVANGNISVRTLENEYKTALGVPMDAPAESLAGESGGGSRPVRRLFISPFHAACWDALQKDVSKLSGEGDVRPSCDFRFTYFSPYAIAVGIEAFGIQFVDGFYPALLRADPSRAELNRVLKDVAFQAPFFRRFWVLTPAVNGVSDIVCAELAATGLSTVGCAELAGDAYVERRKASAMTTLQQQGTLAAAVLEAGIPKARIAG